MRAETGIGFDSIVADPVPDFRDSEYRGRLASEDDYTTLIERPTQVFSPEGELLIVYAPLGGQLDERPAMTALERLHFKVAPRGSGGLMARSITIGYRPRRSLRGDYCSATGLAIDAGDDHGAICAYAGDVTGWYRELNPELYNRHAQEAERVLDDWRIQDTALAGSPVVVSACIGARPYPARRLETPAILDEHRPGCWAASGGAKNGTMAAGWLASELLQRQR